MSSELDLAWLDPSLKDLTRRDADGLGSGLCRAVAQRMGVDVVLVRVAFVVLALSAGLGLALYGWGTALTRGPQGNRPIDSLLPGFRTWSSGSQKTLVMISSLLFTIAIATYTPLPWGAGVLALGALIFLRRRALGPSARFAAPQGGEDLSVDAQLAAWRARLAEAAGPSAPTLPEIDLAATDVVVAAPRPRVRASWLAGLAVLVVGAGVWALASLVLGLGGAVAVASGTIAAGLVTALFAVVVRSRRMPRAVLAVLVVAVGASGWLATQAAAPPTPAPGVLELTATASDSTIDLGEQDLTGIDEVIVRVVASDVTVLVPGQVGELSLDSTLSDLTSEPELVTETGTTVLDRLVIDATASNVEVVRGS